ncbi:MAG: ATP-binding protein [Pseudobdellovibrio sp.]
MYNRLLAESLRKSSKSILLLGPRQVGKSTILLSLKPDLIINLAKEDEFFDFQGNHLELASRMAAAKAKTIYIDEIQRIPRLLNSIQAVIDENPKLKFYLSGSSARKLKKGKANLLPGRLFTYYMNPLCLKEIGADWTEQKAMQYGTLPGVYSLKLESERKKLLQSYANTYLKEEIQAESLVRSLDGFVRFIREAAILSGGYLDYSKLAKKSKIPRQSVVRHFEILEDTLIARKVENDPDLDSDQCDLVKHPRYFFFDIGVVNALRGGFELSHDRIGSMWEYLVYNQIVNTSHALDLETQMYNFRTRGGLEADFIFANNGKKFAIECKSGTSITESDYSNLIAIERYYPKIQKIVIYRGTKEKKQEGVWIVPLAKALDIMGLG